MTEPAKTLSKAQQFALKVEALGDWTVERIRDVARRSVRCSRGDEIIRFTWVRTPAGRDNFADGEHVVAGQSEPCSNVKQTLTLMAEPVASVKIIGERRVRLTYDPAVSEDWEVLEALAGKKIKWVYPMTGTEDEARVLDMEEKRPSKVLRIDSHNSKPEPENRIVTFTSPDGGFRSVRLSDIVEVA